MYFLWSKSLLKNIFWSQILQYFLYRFINECRRCVFYDQNIYSKKPFQVKFRSTFCTDVTNSRPKFWLWWVRWNLNSFCVKSNTRSVSFYCQLIYRFGFMRLQKRKISQGPRFSSCSWNVFNIWPFFQKKGKTSMRYMISTCFTPPGYQCQSHDM